MTAWCSCHHKRVDECQACFLSTEGPSHSKIPPFTWGKQNKTSLPSYSSIQVQDSIAGSSGTKVLHSRFAAPYTLMTPTMIEGMCIGPHASRHGHTIAASTAGISLCWSPAEASCSALSLLFKRKPMLARQHAGVVCEYIRNQLHANHRVCFILARDRTTGAQRKVCSQMNHQACTHCLHGRARVHASIQAASAGFEAVRGQGPATTTLKEAKPCRDCRNTPLQVVARQHWPCRPTARQAGRAPAPS